MRLFESERQAPLFAVFLCTGVILGIIYDFFYVFRLKRKGIFIHISDGIFVLVSFFLTAAAAYIYNSGELRIYFFFGIILGFFAERMTVGSFIKKFIDFSVKIIYNVISIMPMRKGVDDIGEKEK